MSTTTNYIWDEENYLAESDATNTINVVYTNEPQQYGNLISSRIGGTMSYHEFDALGSTRQLTNRAAATTDTAIYDSWGGIVSRTGATNTSLLWVAQPGYYFDPESGAAWVRRRQYTAANARWQSPDPAGVGPDPNRFRYGGNRPIIATDPSGLQQGPTFGKNCSAADQECITNAIEVIKKVLGAVPDCFDSIQCADGNLSSCGDESLRKCILTVLGRIAISCADRGKDGCHEGQDNPGQTATGCGTSKSLVSIGVLPLPPPPGLLPPFPPVTACQPCKSPTPSFNNCSACPNDPGATISLCTDQSPDKNTIASYCKTPADLAKLAALLVHEASHACVGGHATTGGNAGGKPTCDNCRRPDSKSIESAFKKCQAQT